MIIHLTTAKCKSFIEKDGATEVLVDMDAEDEYVEMFSKMWPEGLKKLKEMAENK